MAFWSGSLITIIFIILAITSALFYKESIDTSVKDGHKTILNQITARKELRVGMLRSLTTLYVDYRNANQVGGFEYSLLNKFAESINVKLKITFANNLGELIEKSQEGKIDLIAAEMKGRISDIDNFSASQPFHYTTQQLVYRKGSVKPYTFDEITGNLTVPAGSLQSFILKNTQIEYAQLSWNESTVLNQEELLKQVADQNIDYTIASDRTIAIMQRIYPSLAVAFDVVKNHPKAWYAAKSQDKSLLNKMNQFIQKSLNDGSIKKLEYHYFSYMNKFDYVDTRAFIRAIENTLPKYQTYFTQYAKDNDLDWKLIAAMAYQESHWNPKAISSTGVRGIMMLTKSTAESLGITNRLDPEQSIKGGSRYLKQIINRMPKSIPKEEKVWFALAAYNMGVGHLWDARKLATQQNKNPDSWQDVRQVLPLLSEEEFYTELKYGFARGYQAVHFVDSIQQYYMSLVGYLLEKEYRQQYIDAKSP
ncbi:membrane-bound lytic murein transglycosylase F [Orbus hercynius]|uniref:Membrane-bound lytic murein transglycosylase F n=1 Tax=Orbus hercynius TaxID=593135 RepID=A0A495RCH4_9GAMM|nr:membrane-bound lytic murein transglycosylase MltF [Orbus hercynius]RKS85059.1 membrane-bound lytic murein transglycosylase F [Orbus hercynius]